MRPMSGYANPGSNSAAVLAAAIAAAIAAALVAALRVAATATGPMLRCRAAGAIRWRTNLTEHKAAPQSTQWCVRMYTAMQACVQ